MVHLPEIEIKNICLHIEDWLAVFITKKIPLRLLILFGFSITQFSCSPTEEDQAEPTTLTLVFEGFDTTADYGFVDIDPDIGEVGGTLNLPPALSEKSIKKYVFYFGNANAQLLSASPFAIKTKTGLPVSLKFESNTILPTGATHILVYVRDTSTDIYANLTIPFEDYYDPITNATYASFTDTDPTAGELGGSLVLTPPESQSTLTKYNVYWGNFSGARISETPIGYAVKAEAPTLTIPANTLVPPGATHLLIYSANATNEVEEPLSLEFSDFGPPTHYAASLNFTDTDTTLAEIAGTVTITKAIDESDITAYALYWGTSTTSKKSSTALTTITKRSGAMTYTIAANTAIPSGVYYLLAYTLNTAGEMSTPLALLIDDDGNHAPALDSIGDQTVAEGSPITQVDAGEDGVDFDQDNNPLSYSCFYDTSINGTVSNVLACSTLTGVNFISSTGLLNWTPNYLQAASYEFKITGSDGLLSSSEIFTITVTNYNPSPSISITSPVGDDDTAAFEVNFSVTLSATDLNDAAAISLYRSTSSGNCLDGSLTGWTLITSSLVEGIHSNYALVTDGLGGTTQYICAKIDDMENPAAYSVSGSLAITTNHPPVIDAIGDQTVNEGSAITEVNAGESGADIDQDGQTLTYSCVYDTTINGSVSSSTLCTTITGLSFAGSTGVMNWTPNFSQSNTYEFKISASDGVRTGTELFTVTVNNYNPAPTFSFTQPMGSDDSVANGGTFSVTFTAADGNDAAAISLYRKTTTGNCTDGSLTGWTNLTTTLVEGTHSSYNFVTSGLGGTTQYICARISDSVNSPVYTVSGSLVVHPSPPAAPTNVAATAGNLKNTLTWTASAGATSYNLYWAPINGQGKSGTKISGVTSPYEHTGLTNGTYYYYTIAAENSGGEGSVSTEVYSIPEVDPIITSTSLAATGRSSDRKVIYDTNLSKYWAFYYTGSAIGYSYSTDGNAWTVASTLAYNTSNFTVDFREVSGQGYVFLVVEGDDYDVHLRRGSLGSTSITFDSAITVFNGSSTTDSYRLPTIAIDSTDYVWIVANKVPISTPNSRVAMQSRKSANTCEGNLSSWGSATTVGLPTSAIKTLALHPKSTGNMTLLAMQDATMTAYEFASGSWSQSNSNNWSTWGWQRVTAGSMSINSSSYIYAATSIGNDLYLGGNFTGFAGNKHSNNIVRWDGAAWHSVQQGLSGAVRALYADGTDLYVGGDFVNAGGYASADYIAIWNGSSWAPMGSGTSARVRAINKYNGSIHIGGDFLNAGGNANADYLAKWNGSAWTNVVGVDNAITSLVVHGGSLYIGGYFSGKIGKWDGSSWSALKSGLNNTVNTMVSTSAGLIVGGDFTNCDSIANCDAIALWDGTNWSALSTGIAGTVTSLSSDGTNTYVGGSYTSAGGVSTNVGLAKWNGTAFSAVNLPTNTVGYIGNYYVLLLNSKLYVLSGLAGVSAVLSGSEWSIPPGQYNERSHAVLFDGTNIIVGRSYTNTQLWNGSTWDNLGGNGSNQDYTVAFAGSVNDLYSVGYIESVGVRHWNGSTWSNLGTGLHIIDSNSPDGDVDHAKSVAVSGSDVYVGGNFLNGGEVANADYLAKWNGSSWSALGTTPLNGSVNAILIDGANVYVTGDFTNAGGNASADYIAYWNGSSWNALGTGLNGGGKALAKMGSNIYVGGSFTSAGGVEYTNYIAKWNGSAWSSAMTVNGTVNALAVDGSDLYVGGNFTWNGPDTNYIGRFDGSEFSALDEGLRAPVMSISAKDGRVFAVVGTSYSTLYEYNRRAITHVDSFSSTIDNADRILVTYLDAPNNLQSKFSTAGSWSGKVQIQSGYNSFISSTFDSVGGDIYATFFKTALGRLTTSLFTTYWENAVDTFSNSNSAYMPSCNSISSDDKIVCIWVRGGTVSSPYQVRGASISLP